MLKRWNSIAVDNSTIKVNAFAKTLCLMIQFMYVKNINVKGLMTKTIDDNDFQMINNQSGDNDCQKHWCYKKRSVVLVWYDTLYQLLVWL